MIFIISTEFKFLTVFKSHLYKHNVIDVMEHLQDNFESAVP